ncbi:MAG: FxsA family protein [Dermatophilaceae bacterium]|nr:FxsA family protein [Dermatophilaceae bacterium]
MTTAPGSPRARRVRLTRLALVALMVLPIIEIVVVVAVGQAIGGWPTFLLLVATSLLGAWLIRREGGRAWRALEQAVRSGRMPAREIADGVVVLVGGSLLLAPGFITDVLGLLLVLPFTRPLARSMLAAVISRRLLAQTERFTGPAVAGQPGWEKQGPRRSTSSDEVVEGEIIDED